jgi:predicted permease
VTIVGVGPREFMGTEPLAPDVWLRLTMRKQLRAGDPDFFQNRHAPWVFMIGRLPPGVTSFAAAERELTTIARGLAQAYPAPVRPMSAALGPATFFTIVPVIGQVIALVMAILGLVLLVACANVGNLVLARAMTRQREVALRLALGASRVRLIRQLLTECLLLAAGGAAVGLVLSYWALLILRSIGMTLLPFRWTTVIIDITPDLHVFAYTGVVAAITGVTFGLAPALQAARLDLVAGLRDEASALGLRWRQSRLRDALVVVQIAVCLMLLVAAGLLTRALARAQALDVGFDTHGVIAVDADLTQGAVPAKAVAEFVQRLADRARQLPGVRAVTLTTHVPLVTGAKFTEVRLEGQRGGTQPGEETLGSSYVSVSPDYFDTLKLPSSAAAAFPRRTARAPRRW